jgi:alkanesulfonate monooxygenase SsuD/methylene tetrahydromethanopterin reductase-like flavin-dependent oxidoreductase (luciferase family)
MTDHFFWDDDPTHEAWTVLAFAAARYPAYEVGPMVLGQSYRNPALLAKAAATLQWLSGGRLIMGIGAGWKEDEYHAYGYDFPRAGVRLEQLEDTLEIMTRMWRQPGKVTYHGTHYRVHDAWCEPKPQPPIPLVVGGGGFKTMRLAARFADMWNISDKPLPVYVDRLKTLRLHCDNLGREWGSLRKTWFGRIAVGRSEAEAVARGGGHWTRANAFVGTPAQVVEQMSAFVEAGCDYFMVEVLGLPDPGVFGMVTEDVLPHIV